MQISDGAFPDSKVLMNDGVPGQVRTANLPLRRVKKQLTNKGPRQQTKGIAFH
jgi:hypothetical protein